MECVQAELYKIKCSIAVYMYQRRRNVNSQTICCIYLHLAKLVTLNRFYFRSWCHLVQQGAERSATCHNTAWSDWLRRLLLYGCPVLCWSSASVPHHSGKADETLRSQVITCSLWLFSVLALLFGARRGSKQ